MSEKTVCFAGADDTLERGRRRDAFDAWADGKFGPSKDLPQSVRFASYWECWEAALAASPVPANMTDADLLAVKHAMGTAVHDALFIRIARAVLAAAPSAPAQQAEANVDTLRKALQFYANGAHFLRGDKSAWDTVSGEPQNWWCDDAGTATVEDGSVAEAALAGIWLLDDEDATPPQEPQAPARGAEAVTFESAAAQALESAWRDGWASCRDAEFVGEEAEQDAFNASATLVRCLDAEHPPAPSVEAQAVSEQTLEKIMTQAQVFASSWALIGSPLDDGNLLDSANEEKTALRQMVAALKEPQR